MDQSDTPMTMDRLSRLDALGISLSRTRDEAIEARVALGIEKIWQEDEEHYEGIDDANRGQSKSAWAQKPPGQADGRHVNESRSIVFPNITRPYVDAAAAKIGDTLLPTDERAWSLTATPIPELLEIAKGNIPQPVKEGLAQATAAGAATPEQAQQIVDEEVSFAKKQITIAVERAAKAEKRIEDWMVEGQWHAEMRRVIDDMCRIGTGVLKGPIPTSKRKQAWVDGEIIIKDEIKPISKRVSAWNLYPAKGCGENIHNGSYIWEKDHLTKKKLEELKRDPTYLKEMIDRCLHEGPVKATESRKTADGQVVDDGALYQVWYGYTFAEREDLEAAGCVCKDDLVSVPAIVTLVNGRVIKMRLNPLDSGEFPYDVIPYQRQVGMWAGVGVGRQMRTPQQIVTAGVRTMLTNAGRAAGPMMVLKNNVSSADGTNDITPHKVWYASDDDSTDDARKLISMVLIPDLQESLANIVQMGMKMAEDVTGLPLLLQGQAGSAPDTLGGQQLVDRNASAVLRRVARTVDDCGTEPHTRRYYSWLLQYGEDDEKGDFTLDARGSTALVDKEAYRGELQNYMQASLNPAFDLSPKKIMEEIMRMNRRDPTNFRLTDQEKKALAPQQPAEKPDSSLEVAKIRSDADLKKAQITANSDMAELRFKASEAEKDRRHQTQLKQMDREIKMMELSQATGVSVAKIKAELAGKAMTLRVQKELGGTNAANPVVEPRGTAPEGEAFQK